LAANNWIEFPLFFENSTICLENLRTEVSNTCPQLDDSDIVIQWNDYSPPPQPPSSPPPDCTCDRFSTFQDASNYCHLQPSERNCQVSRYELSGRLPHAPPFLPPPPFPPPSPPIPPFPPGFAPPPPIPVTSMSLSVTMESINYRGIDGANTSTCSSYVDYPPTNSPFLTTTGSEEMAIVLSNDSQPKCTYAGYGPYNSVCLHASIYFGDSVTFSETNPYISCVNLLQNFVNNPDNVISSPNNFWNGEWVLGSTSTYQNTQYLKCTMFSETFTQNNIAYFEYENHPEDCALYSLTPQRSSSAVLNGPCRGRDNNANYEWRHIHDQLICKRISCKSNFVISYNDYESNDFTFCISQRRKLYNTIEIVPEVNDVLEKQKLSGVNFPEIVINDDDDNILAPISSFSDSLIQQEVSSFSDSRILGEVASFYVDFWYGCNYCDDEYETAYNTNTAGSDNRRLLSSLSAVDLPPFES